MNLYELTATYMQACDSDNIADLDHIEDAFKDKAVNVAKYIMSLNADLHALDLEIMRLEDLKIKMLDKRAKLTDYLDYNMQQTGITEIKSPVVNLTYRKTPPKVVVINPELVPDEYKRVKTETSIDKTKLKMHLANGVMIDGVEMAQTKKLVIK